MTARAEPIRDEPRRGRPRSESSRNAILAAAGELLLVAAEALLEVALTIP